MSLKVLDQMPSLVNRLTYDCIAVTRANISGGGGSINTSTGGVYGSFDQIVTTHEVTGYQVTIKYEGRVELKDRQIKQVTFPNYLNNQEVISQANNNIADTKKEFDAAKKWIKVSFIPPLLCFCAPLFVACYYRGIGDKYTAEFNNEVSRLAAQKLADEVTKLLQEADDIVSERIEYLEAPSRRQGSGRGAKPLVEIKEEFSEEV